MLWVLSGESRVAVVAACSDRRWHPLTPKVIPSSPDYLQRLLGCHPLLFNLFFLLSSLWICEQHTFPSLSPSRNTRIRLWLRRWNGCQTLAWRHKSPSSSGALRVVCEPHSVPTWDIWQRKDDGGVISGADDASTSANVGCLHLIFQVHQVYRTRFIWNA